MGAGLISSVEWYNIQRVVSTNMMGILQFGLGSYSLVLLGVTRGLWSPAYMAQLG